MRVCFFSPQSGNRTLAHVGPGDLADVRVFGKLWNTDRDERAVYRDHGRVPCFAKEVSVPGPDSAKRFVVLAQAPPGRPFFRCGSEEVHLRTLLHVYGTDAEHAAEERRAKRPRV